MGTDPDHLELTPEQDTVVRAVFVPKRYRISVETDSRLVERGTVEIEGHPGADAVMVEYGSTVTIKANPNEGFRFAHWKDGKRKKHPEQQLTVRVTGDQTYKAAFKGAEPEVVIAADTWLGGTVTCNGIEVTPATDSFSLGQSLHLKAEPKKGYFFWGWYVNGIFTSLDMECDVVAKGLTDKSERCAVTAAFKPYEVVCLPVASPADGGSVRASRVFTERGAEVALKAQASPMNVSAGEGYGSATGSGTYAAGEVACVSAVPAAGAHFIGWFSGGACLSTDAMYRFPVSADIDLEAVFGMGSFTVSTITASQSSILRGKAFLTSGNGLTSATKTCDKGDPFVAMAIPWSTYRFSH